LIEKSFLETRDLILKVGEVKKGLDSSPPQPLLLYETTRLSSPEYHKAEMSSPNEPYDPYIPSGSSSNPATSGAQGGNKTAAIQAVG